MFERNSHGQLVWVSDAEFEARLLRMSVEQYADSIQSVASRRANTPTKLVAPEGATFPNLMAQDAGSENYSVVDFTKDPENPSDFVAFGNFGNVHETAKIIHEDGRVQWLPAKKVKKAA